MAYTKASKKRKPSAKTKLTAAKAKKMLKDGTAQGKPLTKKQKGFFGAVAGKKKKSKKGKK
jgi:hypothetical protein